ncbi:MAG: UDP-N-acetylmuramoyl-L-alanine--D-glutamate ligase [Deltaproteobacteria bacterium]|nr:UDP-N-acetylmuramoyl-L-alanine--D-glutamate ligase [Deltaproteobacteria bacterium]
MDLKGKRVLVVGLARTGLAVSRFLVGRGARVTAADLMTQDALGAKAREARDLGISLQLGPHDAHTFLSQDLIVVSPGVPEQTEPLGRAARAGIPVIGELELAFRYVDAPVVAVTGTNGKTTTTRLIGDMLQASGKKVFVGGNIGRPLIELVDRGQRVEVIVVEVSSFQLDTAVTFRPRVGVLLNISEDHMDRYERFEDYMHSKGRLFENQGPEDVAILNEADRFTRDLEEGIQSQRLYFNRGVSNGSPGAGVHEGTLVCRMPQGAAWEFDLADFGLSGRHNAENACAAVLAAAAIGGSFRAIQKALKAVRPLPHRLQDVKTVRGVRYVDDSKGTNVGAVVRALDSYDAPVILIMGGRDKGGDYGPLKKPVAKKVKRLIVLGEAKGRIAAVLGAMTEYEQVKDLEQAVRLASNAARPGDVVLLSPGCSSFDMFHDYKERGDAFSRAVEAL